MPEPVRCSSCRSRVPYWADECPFCGRKIESPAVAPRPNRRRGSSIFAAAVGSVRSALRALAGRSPGGS